jgi:hypothetical protein
VFVTPSWRKTTFLVHVFIEVKIFYSILRAIEKKTRMWRGSDYGNWSREFSFPQERIA